MLSLLATRRSRAGEVMWGMGPIFGKSTYPEIYAMVGHKIFIPQFQLRSSI